MNMPKSSVATLAADIPPRTRRSVYPEPFFSRMAGRQKTALGDFFGLTNFGVNLTRIQPGGESALRHSHTKQDEFVFVLSGNPTLVTNAGEQVLAPGMCVGFKAGTGDAHQLVNRTDKEAVYLEVGDRSPGDTVTYPDDDIQAISGAEGWIFLHKNGAPYPPAPG